MKTSSVAELVQLDLKFEVPVKYAVLRTLGIEIKRLQTHFRLSTLRSLGHVLKELEPKNCFALKSVVERIDALAYLLSKHLKRKPV